ncbi:MAG: peptidylprolyl isomerase [Rhodanobacteraceae bacterium]|nr:peptidylprolyl isomerase [Rhodanobacteraceae bacterium]
MRKVILGFGLLASAVAGAAGTSDADTLVVSQGVARVTLGDVDAYVHRIPESDRVGFVAKPERIETMLRNMLLDKQLADEARKLGLDKDPVVQRQIALAVENALSRARMEAFRSSLKAPDFSEQAQEDYLANKEKYTIPKRYDVKHILFDIKTRTHEQAKVLAEETATKLAADPSKFDSLVEELSDDSSKKDNHGLIENAASSSFVTPFAEAASRLEKIGDISPPVRTVFGYHILKLVKTEPEQLQPYEVVRESIISRLTAEWMEAKIRGKLDGLRNETMQPQPEVLATLRERFGTIQLPPDASAAPPESTSEQP